MDRNKIACIIASFTNSVYAETHLNNPRASSDSPRQITRKKFETIEDIKAFTSGLLQDFEDQRIKEINQDELKNFIGDKFFIDVSGVTQTFSTVDEVSRFISQELERRGKK